MRNFIILFAFFFTMAASPIVMKSQAIQDSVWFKPEAETEFIEAMKLF
jgi:hypothetical protein